MTSLIKRLFGFRSCLDRRPRIGRLLGTRSFSPKRARSALGFSLLEMLLIAAMIGIVAAMAVPGLLNGVDRLRLGMATRDVQSELQSARLKAVSANTLMRVRFDCPSAGQFRMIE